MSKSKRRPSYFSRRSRFESLEDRIVLDTQIGTVVMPYDGYLSAAIYDSNNQIVRTLLAQVPEQAGNIPLMWDGKDQLGRSVDQSGTYTWKSLTSQVNPLDQGSVGDSEAVPTKIDPNQGYFVKSLTTSTVAGTSGDVGGTFARNDNESYFGDTALSQSFTLNDTLSASGRFYFTDVASMKGKFFIGHFSSSTADTRREFMGLEFSEGDNDGSIGVCARINRFNGNASSDAWSDGVNLGVRTGYYNWSYTYDPNYEADSNHAGPEGRLTLHITSNLGFDYTVYAVNDGSHRDAGSTFDAFGMGISTQEANTGDNPSATAKLFMDDVTYSGHTGVQNFTTNPSWTAVGNTSDGNSYGWNSYSNTDNSLYETSNIEEVNEINKIGADASLTWVNDGGVNFGSAADQDYFYVSQNVSSQDRIYRYTARDGSLAPFAPGVNFLVVNSSAPDTLPASQLSYHYTSEQWRDWGTAWGMAADGNRLWVSDYRNNRLLVYDRSSGSLLGQYSITKPLGIAVDTSSSGTATVWVANNGDRLTKITFNGSFTASTTITGLADPTGVAIGGPSHPLFVAESGTTHIREYDISGTPALAGLQIFGSKHPGGPLGDSQFYWNTLGDTASLTVDSNGILSVTDDHRVQRFYTVTAGGHTAGTLYDSLFSEFAPTPIETYNYTAGGKHYLLSNRYVYEVDPDYTGGPRAGWYGDGSWRLTSQTITASDGYVTGVGGFNSSGHIRVGSTGGTSYSGWLHFPSVQIPYGALLSNASLRLRANTSDSGSATASIYGTKLTTTPIPTTYGTATQSPYTTATQAWTLPSTTAGSDYDSPDITAVIQEIVNQASWVAGGDILIHVDDASFTGYREFKSFEDDAAHAATLNVQWS